MGGKAREVVSVGSETELRQLFETLPPGTPWMVVGGGSNVIFPDTDVVTLLIRPDIQGMRIEEVNPETVLFSIGAGVPWDEAVAYSVELGLAGLEPLSFIPGLSGAVPVQNVGAYGRETSDVLTSLRAYDTKFGEFVVFSNEECSFGYRDSIFKREGKGRLIFK